MAKVTITMTIDVPGIEESSEAEAAQNLFDDVTNYLTICHFRDTVSWLVRAKGGESSTAHRIYKHHELWAEIMDGCEWSFKVEGQ